ncbi:hypothetical protein AB837_00585 [bacterium AB1]|nr:hypothetical protein AB837_00585 [bacterium AB1]
MLDESNILLLLNNDTLDLYGFIKKVYNLNICICWYYLK